MTYDNGMVEPTTSSKPPPLERSQKTVDQAALVEAEGQQFQAALVDSKNHEYQEQREATAVQEAR